MCRPIKIYFLKSPKSSLGNYAIQLEQTISDIRNTKYFMR